MLLSWRRQAETISDIGKLLSFIEEKVEEIEDMSNLQLIPLCRMDEAIGQALQVSSAPQPPIPGPINTGDVLPQAVRPGFPINRFVEPGVGLDISREPELQLFWARLPRRDPLPLAWGHSSSTGTADHRSWKMAKVGRVRCSPVGGPVFRH